MIYRNWSLLSSTVVIWGSVATAGLAGIFVFGGKVVPPPASAPIPPVEAPNPNRPCSPAVSFPESCVCIASPSIVASHVYEVLIVPAFAVVRFVAVRTGGLQTHLQYQFPGRGPALANVKGHTKIAEAPVSAEFSGVAGMCYLPRWGHLARLVRLPQPPDLAEHSASPTPWDDAGDRSSPRRAWSRKSPGEREEEGTRALAGEEGPGDGGRGGGGGGGGARRRRVAAAWGEEGGPGSAAGELKAERERRGEPLPRGGPTTLTKISALAAGSAP
ncbi:hypothetical protein PR202_gb18120 [Eleusine coracana subsp. coracana]|uniref:Uncharacterized protein n=1 Tax=Eleusine coracana subsp. coracana TaxID=191504 RepID=A0AAV5F2G9_ELECO|nr:hypothetical protein PR202_gb18120 [Eleusine coracana subsp. coracana]